MGITVKLESESGTEIQCVEDPTNVLHRALPEPGRAGFQWANTIDWYGDTVFNHLQATSLRKEWVVLIQNATDEATKKVLERIDGLLQECASGNHLYIKFYGD
jgi:hypothetical protein